VAIFALAQSTSMCDAILLKHSMATEVFSDAVMADRARRRLLRPSSIFRPSA
jgi:hypothetical protein